MGKSLAPALRPEEWARRVTAHGQSSEPDYNRLELALLIEGSARLSGDSLHALAALALYGQPFGFTWVDVDLIRESAEEHPWIGPDHDGPFPSPEIMALADRIAALLPPREER